MNKLLISMMLTFIPSLVSARETIYFCEKVTISHGPVQFMRIDNSEDFKIEAKSKHLHEVIALSKEPSFTSLKAENGQQMQELILEQNCDQDEPVKSLNLDDYGN